MRTPRERRALETFASAELLEPGCLGVGGGSQAAAGDGARQDRGRPRRLLAGVRAEAAEPVANPFWSCR